MTVSVRNALKSDIEGIMLIEHESFHEDIAESRDVFLGRVNIFPEGFLVLEIDGEIAGYISSEIWDGTGGIDPERFDLNHGIAEVHKTTGSHLYISSMGIMKKHREKGYGKLLFSELAKQICDRYGISRIILIVSDKWDAARKIYEKNGFVEVQRIPGFFDDDGSSDAIVMIKRV